MRSMLFAISLMLMLVALTMIQQRPTNFSSYHIIYELYANDATVKEIINHMSVKVEKESDNLTLTFAPNLEALVDILEEIKNYTGYNISLPLNKTEMKFIGLENNTYVGIIQINQTTNISVYIPNYTNIKIRVLANYTATVLNWTEELLTSPGDAEILIDMENYSMAMDDLCSPCYLDFNAERKKIFNFTVANTPGITFEMNFSLYNKWINISHTGNVKIIVEINTNVSDMLVISGNKTIINMTNNSTACEYAPLPRIPEFANASYISYGEIQGKKALVMNSTAGAVIYLDMNDNCRFDDLQDLKIARENDFIFINNVVYHIATLDYKTGCPIRWKVYANDTEEAWNESQIFEFWTTKP